jgi:hypothetical protein
MSDLRVHMSFDLAHDRDLHDLLVAQTRRRSGFAIASRSEAGDITEEWAARVRGRIAGCDEVIVLCGEHTDQSAHVSAELKIAQEERKPYVLLWGRRDSMCKKPRSARVDDGMYKWTAELLERQLAAELRRSREKDVPERMKRQTPAPRVSSAS